MNHPSQFSPLEHKREDSSTAQTKMISPFHPISGTHSPSLVANTPASVAIDPAVARMQQLEKMLQEAQGKTEDAEREAYAKAYALGEEAGIELGQKRAEQMLQSMEQSLADMEQQLASLHHAFSEVTVDVATSMAEHVMGHLNESHLGMLLDSAENAARQLPDLTGLKLAISPDSMDLFHQILPERNSDWKLITDANLSQYACRIISTQQDILIDPIASLQEYGQRIRADLLSPTSESETNMHKPPTNIDETS
ncbi:MAG: FliH/SctL family protein [Mariprofundaceae bacterium]